MLNFLKWTFFCIFVLVNIIAMEEKWIDIIDFENLYEISNLGNVRSKDRIIEANSRWGVMRKMLFKGKALKQFVGKNGYAKVSLCKGSKPISKDVHRLVYESFNGKITGNMQVNHIDENKLNNRLNNLNLLSPKDNTNYGTHNERMKKTKRKRLQKM